MKNTRREKWQTEDTDALIKAILSLRNVKEAKRFFRDLLTETEIVEFANRWKVARMLDRGVPYKEIEALTGMSSTTIARIARWLKEGRGGYRTAIRKLKKL